MEKIKFQYISCYCLSQKFYLKSYQCTLFQYISCYCLSHFLLLVQMQLFNFNTSHVTVYQSNQSTLRCRDTFQYISCYCLSGKCVSECRGNYIFQYISCYCLSTPLSFSFFVCSSFQYISCYCLSLFQLHYKLDNVISIHLMLLFIFLYIFYRITFY